MQGSKEGRALRTLQVRVPNAAKIGFFLHHQRPSFDLYFEHTKRTPRKWSTDDRQFSRLKTEGPSGASPTHGFADSPLSFSLMGCPQT